MKKNEKKKGSEGFREYYEALFGTRWNDIEKSFTLEPTHIQLDYGNEPYFLDAASICAALCLPLENCEKVLDLCAAPGGKTLVLKGNLKNDSMLYSNERSPERKKRLDNVVETVLGEQKKNVKTSCSDGATWCRRETECYDAILLDAPCSSERHVISDPKYLNQWSPSRIKSLAIEQWALLSCAWRLLKHNGYILYATCALSPMENDEIISKLLKKFDDVELLSEEMVKNIFSSNLSNFSGKLTFKNGEETKDAMYILNEAFSAAEKTKHGFHILPDKASFFNTGAGPLFFCLIHKKD